MTRGRRLRRASPASTPTATLRRRRRRGAAPRSRSSSTASRTRSRRSSSRTSSTPSRRSRARSWRACARAGGACASSASPARTARPRRRTSSARSCGRGRDRRAARLVQQRGRRPDDDAPDHRRHRVPGRRVGRQRARRDRAPGRRSCRPTSVIVLKVGLAHAGGFGGIEETATREGRDGRPTAAPRDVAVLNLDDSARGRDGAAPRRAVCASSASGRRSAADVRAADIDVSAAGHVLRPHVLPGGERSVRCR